MTRSGAAWRLIVPLSLALTCARPAPAQEAGPPLQPERLTPVEVVRLFDAYAVVRAQDALDLDTSQYGAFVARYRVLLEARRRHQEARQRLLGELARQARPQRRAPDEAGIRATLRDLDEQDTRGLADIRAALTGVEQGLSAVQQARFRVFEEQMERRKLELLSRARQARPGRRAGPPSR